MVGEFDLDAVVMKRAKVASANQRDCRRAFGQVEVVVDIPAALMCYDTGSFADGGFAGPGGGSPEGIGGVGGPVKQVGRPFDAEPLPPGTHGTV